MEEVARAGFKSSEANGQYGPGHNSFTTTPDGKTDILVYHAREYRDILGSELADRMQHACAGAALESDGTPDFGEPEADIGKVAPKPLYRDPLSTAPRTRHRLHGSYGRWYMLYTNRRANAQATQGGVGYGTRIGIAESLDAGVTWKYIGEADIELPAEFGGPKPRWAPDVVRDDMGCSTCSSRPFRAFSRTGTIRGASCISPARTCASGASEAVKLATDRAIDASVFRLPSGDWRMFYNNETDNKAIWYADSADLENWTDRGKLITDQAGEGPKAFQWRGKWWLITDVWHGLAVYSSDDGLKWTRQANNLLESPGKGADDQVKGAHADVVVAGDRAWLFYFTHPDQARRSSIQVVELQEDGVMLKADRDSPTHIALRAR